MLEVFENACSAATERKHPLNGIVDHVERNKHQVRVDKRQRASKAGTIRAKKGAERDHNGYELRSARLRLGLAGLTCGVGGSRRLDAFGILTNHRAPDQSSTTLPSSYLTCIAFLGSPNAPHPQSPLGTGINTTDTLQPTHTHQTSTPDPRRLPSWRLCCLRAAWNDRRKVEPYQNTW